VDRADPHQEAAERDAAGEKKTEKGMRTWGVHEEPPSRD
jgi:hypothetical protein